MATVRLDGMEIVDWDAFHTACVLFDVYGGYV
jgi:hypothetical protein